MLRNKISRIPLAPLVILALTLGLAPFTPMPHLLEKLLMLLHGSLTRPIDQLDLLMHASPFILLIVRVAARMLSKPTRPD